MLSVWLVRLTRAPSARSLLIAIGVTVLILTALFVPPWLGATIPEREFRRAARAILLVAQPAYGAMLALMVAGLIVPGVIVIWSRRRGFARPTSPDSSPTARFFRPGRRGPNTRCLQVVLWPGSVDLTKNERLQNALPYSYPLTNIAAPRPPEKSLIEPQETGWSPTRIAWLREDAAGLVWVGLEFEETCGYELFKTLAYGAGANERPAQVCSEFNGRYWK